MNCKYCGSNKEVIIRSSLHIGLYCSECDKWKKWIKKSDLKLYKIKGVVIK